MTFFNSYHYSGDAFTDPQRLVDRYMQAVEEGEIPPHDTLIGTGISGSIAVPMLALTSKRHFALVRKPGVSSHSRETIEGMIGERWLFVDDFIASGDTYLYVKTTVEERVPGAVLVGAWLYKYHSNPRFRYPEEL